MIDHRAATLAVVAVAMSYPATAQGTQDPEPGIAFGLAQSRAGRVNQVRYQLSFRLEPGAKVVDGSAKVTFTLSTAAAPLVIDFAGDLTSLQVNGRDPGDAARAANGHLVLAAGTLRTGANEVQVTFRSAVAAAGTPLTVYHDAADGEDYYYTLVVPADAHRLYPCFDQPDLKAVFELRLDLPAKWTALANGRERRVTELPGGRRLWDFAPTRPLPTYLAAFCCGPFDVVEGPVLRAAGIEGSAPMRMLIRPNQRAKLDSASVGRLHDEGLAWLAKRFGVDYPFGKLDVALLPGFPYGGMEHAGAIFYREQALAFDHAPTAAELVRRSTLVYHELSHQWFGNLVTMRWFDDLWLKEGFATFLGHQMLAELEPERQSWLRFLQRVKPRAYEVDATAGTTPVWQELSNLADAKSNYGAIVYNKAPAVLRELHERIGADAFGQGLKAFLRQHAYANATWRDLASALEQAAGLDLQDWSNRWIRAASMPQVRVGWEVDRNGVVARASWTQRALDGEGGWPLQWELLVFDLAGGRRTVLTAGSSAEVALPELVGRAAPACVLPNPRDVAYGQFVPDPISRAWILDHCAEESDPLVRAVMVSGLVEAVREAELDPARLAALLLDLLMNERDPDTHGWLLDALQVCLQRWLPERTAQPLVGRATELLLGQLRGEGNSGRELQTFRFLARASSDPPVLALCRAVARGEALPKGLAPGKQDRFLAAAALLAAGVEAGEIDQLAREFAGSDPGKEVFLARAAAADPSVKAAYWEQYQRLDTPPEQWVQDSLAWFHWPGQGALTLPYLAPALQRVEWVKANRRIFFMPAWIDAFVNGHDDLEAQHTVQEFLARPGLSPDIRRKVQQSLDGLERAVRIKRAFARQG